LGKEGISLSGFIIKKCPSFAQVWG